MAALGEDVLNCRVVEHDGSILQLSSNETIDDFQMPEVIVDSASMDPASMDPASMDPASVDPASVDPASVDPASMDKEMLRKIKRKERTKLNRKRKKALQRNLSQVNASELQQSVSALATTIGISTSSLVNDPLTSYSLQEPHMPQNFVNSVNAADDHGLLGSTTDVADTVASSRMGTEIPLCVLDASNFNARLANLDLAYITDYLERNMFKDLTLVPKLKIDNIYLSSSKRVWIICSSGATLSWVTRRVSEMPALNGRKYAVHTLAELEVMTQVSVLVPKECSLVNNYNDLMLFLTLQNPGLGRGLTTLDLQKRGTAERAIQDPGNEDEATREDATAVKGADEVPNETVEEVAAANKPEPHNSINGFTATPSSLSNTKCDAISPLKQAPGSSIGSGSTGTSSEVEKHPPLPRSRTYVFYADDTWLMELRRLGCRPYLGARRLLCVVGERLVQRSHDGATGPAKKRRRGGRRVAGGLGAQRIEKGESEGGQDTAPAAVPTEGMLALG